MNTLRNQDIQATRLNNGQPIITPQMFHDAGVSAEQDDEGLQFGGGNINGPSLIRVPDWLSPEERAHPEARYYCYFASYRGQAIRMAWAADIAGPYELFNPLPGDQGTLPGCGVLDVSDTVTFRHSGSLLASDCASPDVIVDHEQQRILCFVHIGRSTAIPPEVIGTRWYDTGGQVSYVATSRTGLNFNGGPDVTQAPVTNGEAGHGIRHQALGNAYMRVFPCQGHWHAFSNCGPIWRGPALDQEPWAHAWHCEKWTPGQISGGGNPVWMNLHDHVQQHGLSPHRHYAGWRGEQDGPAPVARYADNAPYTSSPRHFAIRPLANEHQWEVWYSCRGEKPESIFRTILDTSDPDFRHWTTAVTGDDWIHQRVLWPEQEWEGAQRPLTISTTGAEHGTNGLRDPAVFVDTDDRVYVLYCGGPEEAIGIAEITYSPAE